MDIPITDVSTATTKTISESLLPVAVGAIIAASAIRLFLPVFLKLQLSYSETLAITDSSILSYCTYRVFLASPPPEMWQHEFRKCYETSTSMFKKEEKEKKFFELYEKDHIIECFDDSTSVSVSAEDMLMAFQNTIDERTSEYMIDTITSIKPDNIYIHLEKTSKPLEQFEKKVIDILNKNEAVFNRPPLFVTSYFKNIPLSSGNTLQVFWIVKIDYDEKRSTLYSSNGYTSEPVVPKDILDWGYNKEAEEEEFERLTQNLVSAWSKSKFAQRFGDVAISPSYVQPKLIYSRRHFDISVSKITLKVVEEIVMRDTLIFLQGDRIYELYKKLPAISFLHSNDASTVSSTIIHEGVARTVQLDKSDDVHNTSHEVNSKTQDQNQITESLDVDKRSIQTSNVDGIQTRDEMNKNIHNSFSGGNLGIQNCEQVSSNNSKWYAQNIEMSVPRYELESKDGTFKEQLPTISHELRLLTDLFLSKARCQTKRIWNRSSPPLSEEITDYVKSIVPDTVLSTFRTTGLPSMVTPRLIQNEQQTFKSISNQSSRNDVLSISGSTLLYTAISAALSVPRISPVITLRQRFMMYTNPSAKEKAFLDTYKQYKVVECFDDLFFPISLSEITSFYTPDANLTSAQLNYAIASVYFYHKTTHTYIPLHETDFTKQQKFFENEVMRMISENNPVGKFKHTYVTVLELIQDKSYMCLSISLDESEYNVKMYTIKEDVIFSDVVKSTSSIMHEINQKYNIGGVQEDTVKVTAATLEETADGTVLSKVVHNKDYSVLIYEDVSDGISMKWRTIRRVVSLLGPYNRTLEETVNEVRRSVLDVFLKHGVCKVTKK